MAKNLKKKNYNFFLFLPFIFILVIYLHNLSRDIYGGDVGDLVTSAYVFGVAHPPGYPLFTLIGFLLSKLPIMIPPVSKIGLISVFSSIGSLFLYFKLSQKLTKDTFISFIGMFTLAFSYLFWLYSVMPEAFSLNIFLAFLVCYFAFQFITTKKTFYFYILIFLLSFSLSNHHTIVLIYPGIFVLIFPQIKSILQLKKLFISLFVFLLGFMPYLYIPFAASRNPPMNWDSATNLPNLINLFLRKDYGTFSPGNFSRASSFFEFLIIGRVYFEQIIKSITLPAFIISILGALHLFKINTRLFIAIALGFILSGPLFVIYSGFPLLNSFIIGISERFYILSSALLLIFFPFGILLIKKFFEKILTQKRYAILIVSVFGIIPFSLFAINFQKTNLSEVKIGNKLAYAVLASLPKNSVVVLDGDTIVTNSWYVHYVLGYRPDIQLVQLGGFANNSYMEGQIENFKKENNENYSIVKVLDKINTKRRIFFTSQVPYKDVLWVPMGLSSEFLFKGKIAGESNYIKEQKELWTLINPPLRKNLSMAESNLIPSSIPLIYSSALVRTGDFIYQKYHNIPGAFYFYKKAQEVDPQYSLSYINMGIIQFKDLGLCSDAEKNLKRGTELTVEKQYFLLMYLNYNICFKDAVKAKKYKEYFKQRFNRDIDKEIKK